MKSLDGKVAIITGGGTGIGRETALLFANEGAKVFCIGRRAKPIEDVAAEIRSMGGEAVAHSADLEDGDKAAGIGTAAVSAFGRVDILVNNAGHSSRARSILKITPEEWRSVFLANVEGLYRLTQSVLPQMISNGGGTVVTVASTSALSPSLLGGAPYGAAKAAAHNLMSFISSELRDQGIRASTVFPAEVDTPILEKRPRPPSAEERSIMMKPADVARAILLCASLPLRTQVDSIVISPTRTREFSADFEAARNAS